MSPGEFAQMQGAVDTPDSILLAAWSEIHFAESPNQRAFVDDDYSSVRTRGSAPTRT